MATIEGGKRCRRTLLLGALLLVGAGAAVAGPSSGGDRPPPRSPAEPRSDGVRPVRARDMAPALPNDADQSEVWSYHLFFEDSIRVHLTLFRTNVGFPIGRVVGSELSILGLTDTPHAVVRRFSDERFLWTETPEIRLQVHPDIGVTGSPLESQHILFATRKDGVTAELDLRLDEIEPGLVRGDGALVSSPLGRVVMLPLVGRARVAGTVRLGDRRVDVRGTGYMDHVYLTRRPDRLLADVYQFIDHRDDAWSAGVVYRAARRVGGGHGGVVISGGADAPTRLRTIDDVEIEQRQEHLGVELPVRLRTDADGLLTSLPPAQRFSVLDSVSGVARVLFRTFVGGEVVLLRGDGARDGRAYAYTYSSIR